jgi:hypothetical protein
VLGDPALVSELGPKVLREEEMGRVVAVKVTDLALANLEGELAAPAGARLDPGPGRDLFGDSLAECLRCRHGGPPAIDWLTKYKFK